MALEIMEKKCDGPGNPGEEIDGPENHGNMVMVPEIMENLWNFRHFELMY